MKAIRVAVHREESTWWADSPDVPGWTAAAPTRTELEHLIAGAEEFVFECRPYVICEGVVPTAVFVS